MSEVESPSLTGSRGEKIKQRKVTKKYSTKPSVTWQDQTKAQNGEPIERRKLPGFKYREGWKLEISEEEVFEVAFWHEKLVRGPIVLTDLPKFDDTAPYDIDEGVEKDLVKLEVRRLIDQTTSDKPLLFDSKNLLGSKQPDNFKIMSDFADQILCNLAIISHDNQLLLLEHSRSDKQLMKAAIAFSNDRSILKRSYQPNDMAKPQTPTRISPEKDNAIIYFALVDYTTSIVARVLLRLASSKFWRSSTIAVLARWSVKLKALYEDPEMYACQALADGEGLIAQLKANDDQDINNQITLHFVNANNDNSEPSNKGLDLLADAGLEQLYFNYNSMVRNWLLLIYKISVFSFHSNQSFLNEPSTFEVCNHVYEAGLSRSLTAIGTDRDGDVYATSDPRHLNCSYVVQKLLVENLDMIKLKQPPESGQTQTTIRWCWTEGRKDQSPNETTFGTSNIDDIVSTLVLLSLSTSYATTKMLTLITAISVNSEEEDPVLQFIPRHFQSRFVVSTADYSNKQHRLRYSDSSYRDSEVVPVSGNFLSKPIRAGTNLKEEYRRDPIESQRLPSTEKAPASKEREDRVTQKYLDDEKIIRHWIFAETTITVKCRGYIMIVILFCAVILGGGLSIPFTVKEKLPGVDPFQITLFTWLLVGAILIVAKTRYVTEWPWHDFLHGRVVCKSISDLADVTGIDAQMILTKLLHDERNITLVTRGPYNGMFTRTAEAGSEGFSINVPVQCSTMLASGFIILKVLSSSGEHLITLDVRRGTDEDLAHHDAVDVEHLACLDLGGIGFDDENDDSRNTLGDGPKVLYLVRTKLDYTKVLGLYIGNSLFG